MQEPKFNGNGTVDNPVEHLTTPEIEHIDHDSENHGGVVATVATVAVVGIAAVAFEVALLPGIVLGVAAAWVPQQIFRK